jgi:hypothetical protein
MLDEAIRLVASGETDRGLALLDDALRLSPRLWQARQYRGQMRLGEPDAAESALQDFKSSNGYNTAFGNERCAIRKLGCSSSR